MGDRANVIVKSEGEQVSFYTHWEGTNLPQIVQSALIRGKGRWNDYPYLARIIFSEMIQNYVLEETGYGISQDVADGSAPTMEVHVSYEDGCSVELNGKLMPVEEFIDKSEVRWEYYQ